MNPQYDAGRADRLNNRAYHNVYKDDTEESGQYKQGWESVANSIVDSNTVNPAPVSYQAGKDAHGSNVAVAANPYARNTVDYNAWISGWNDANGTPIRAGQTVTNQVQRPQPIPQVQPLPVAPVVSSNRSTKE